MDKFKENFEKIFGKREKCETGRWVWSEKEDRLVKADSPAGIRVLGAKLHIVKEIDPFVSPIDGTVIHSRAQRDRHMKQHGVTHASDYSNAYYEKAAKARAARLQGSTPEDKAERINLIKREIEKHERD